MATRSFGAFSRVWSIAGLAVAVTCAGCGGSGDGDGSSGDPGSGGTDGAGGSSGTGTTTGTTTGTDDIDVSTNGNPFTGASFYINPDYVAQVQSSIDMSPADGALLEKVKAYPTAIWLDRIAMVEEVGPHLDAALAQQQEEGKPVVSVLVVYDLPNRDCAALASNGELHIEDGGVERYRTEFIDAIAAEFQAHPNQRKVAIIEPDSLGNIATNLSLTKCAESEQVYRDSVAYAISTLSAIPNTYLYLDAAHAGWLGWPDNQNKIATIFKEVLDAAGGTDTIRGFATNVANYTVLHEVPELHDYEFNPCHDETIYTTQLGQTFAAAGITNRAFLIDTSRNGLGGLRAKWGSWCNVDGAGLGERPRADPAAGLDAYFWVKPPGESDGTTDPSSPRFDASCASDDSALNAPEAGASFHPFFVMLAQNANPPL